MTLIQPNLTSNLPAVSRVDIVARQNPAPKRAVAEYTEAAGQMERALLRAMIEAAKAKRAPVKVDCPQTIITPRIRHDEVEARMMAAIGSPKTAVEIEAETGLPSSTVKSNLRRMAVTGRIEAKYQGRHPTGQNKPFLYAELGTFSKPHDFKARRPTPTKPELRDAVLEVLKTPHAPFQVSEVLGIGRANARYQISRLAEAGLIRPAGIVDVPRTKGVQQWVAK